MTDVLNKGDELAIYALCDMLKRHAFVYTSTKPWTTVDSNAGCLSVTELCMLCDVRLIYLGNNKFSELKCKPEILSPLPRLLPVKHESPASLDANDHITASPTKEMVVGVLDANQSSCTLITLPCSPTASQIDANKKTMTLEPDVETNVETDIKTTVEQPIVETQPDISTDNLSSLSVETLNTEMNVITTDSNSNKTNEVVQENVTITEQTVISEDKLNEEPVEMTQPTTPAADLVNFKKPESTPITQPEIISDNTVGDPKESKPRNALLLPSQNESTSNSTSELPSSNSTTTPVPLNKLPMANCSKTQPETCFCTVRLEILTESDIIKHVHLHRKEETPVETVETEHVKRYTRSSTRTKVARTSRHPRSATKDVDYSNLGTDDCESLSPTPKRQRLS